jgi:hypothetical protein
MANADPEMTASNSSGRSCWIRRLRRPTSLAHASDKSQERRQADTVAVRMLDCILVSQSNAVFALVDKMV